MEINQIITASTSLGFYILSHGAETYRVEESITRICRAYGNRSADVFVIPSSIVVTLEDENGDFITKTKRVLRRDTDLDKVDQLNDLCRRICRDKPEFDDIMGELQRIESRAAYSQTVQLLSWGMISAFFTLFYGGNFADAVTAFVIGVAVSKVLKLLSRFGGSDFFSNIVGGAFTALVCDLAVALGFAFNMDKMIIGILMNLVPGIALTNAMREFIASDIISGIIKLVEALFVAAGIAIGVMMSLAYIAPFVEGLLL